MTNYTVIESVSALKAETLSSLINLDQLFFPKPWSKESWEQVFKSESVRIIVLAENHNELKGFALYDTSIADSFAHLLKIAVNPSARGLGIGKNILNESINFLKESGIKSIFLEVEENNLAAINLYQQFGFKIIHQKKQYYTSGASALIMTLSV